MSDTIMRVFSEDGFMPHGMCYLWRPGILSLHVVSDALIALAYASIPFTLVYFVRRRRDLEFSWMFVCFAIFIIACGTTHIMEIYVIWHPAYWLSGIIKAVTALASVPTAILLVKLVPAALHLPSASALQKANIELNREVEQRQRAEREIRDLNRELESRVAQRTSELEATNRNLIEEARERKRMEQGLRDSESRLRHNQELLQAVIDNSTAVIYVKDVAGRYLLANRRYEELFHVTEDWLIGKTDYDIFPKENADAFREVDIRVFESTAPLQIEEVAPHDDGLHTYVSTKCRLRDADGEAYAICGISTDITERKHADDRFRLALEAAPTGMLMVDENGSIVLVNEQIEQLFKYARDELIGMPMELLVPERFRGQHPVFRSAYFEAPQTRAMGRGRDLYGLRKDGTEMPIEIALNPFHTPQGMYVLSSIADISERKLATEQLRQRTEALTASLSERDVLLQEVHHRVKNNLQIISSLINMQARKLGVGPQQDQLKDCKSRVDAIAMIHEQLYQSSDFAHVPFSEYVRNLVNNIVHAANVSTNRINVHMAIEQIALSVDKAIPCGLILNELMTNALKHAFPDGRSGTIRVELGVIDDGFGRLVVSDDGVGMPDSQHTTMQTSIGMVLIATLTEQLQGRLTISREHGTSLRVEFPTHRNGQGME